ncbi:MAG TPA: BamA/TamA family outer membrane protein [Longimicrobiales bacterium]|nr:BamA/TamA family outer membrane protein [Longimicrobiales bacterium]
MQRLIISAFVVAAAAAPVSGQTAPVASATDTAGAYVDAGAASLVARARAARQRTDRSMRSYTAVVRSRVAAGLRMPLKDRTLFRSETAVRARWSRDAETVVQVLAAREQHPGGVEIPKRPSGLGIDELFDPTKDRMYFGIGSPDSTDAQSRDEDDFYIEHPIGADAERHYRYQSGDTMTLTLGDGRVLRTAELIVMPRRSDPHTVKGVLWLEIESGALVQAAFRLARTVDILTDFTDAVDDEDVGKIPGFMKPLEFDISLMTVEYSLWEGTHWLPRSMRIEGMARAGVFRAPAAAEVTYRMEEVEIDDGSPAPDEHDTAARIAREWNGAADHHMIERKSDGRPFLMLVPDDSTRLVTSDELPPPIWDSAPGFISEDELQSLADRIAKVAGPGRAGFELKPRFGWGFGEPDMIRYNRVEALSVGARVTLPLPELDVVGTVRLGAGDLHPNAELLLRRETSRRTLELRGYHELTTTDDTRRPLGLGNSLSALVLGRDEGEYYRASGAMLTLAPPWAERRSWDASIYGEKQDDVERHTHIALPRAWNDSVFRSNIVADEARQYGAMLRFRPWWGTDPLAAQFGIDMLLQGEGGDFEHGRARVTLRAAAPLFAGVRVGFEAAAGTSTGSVPVQRLFYLGGASTLRGYEPGTVRGTSMARGRVELARTLTVANFALFSDWGWAGDRDNILDRDQRLSVGIGASLLDGFLRVDLARGLRAPTGWRIDMHLDAIL